MKTKIKSLFDDCGDLPTDQEFAEMFGELRKACNGNGRFAVCSMEDIRQAGKEAGKDLKRI